MSAPRERVRASRARVILTRSLLVIGVVLLVAGFAGWWLIATPPGAKWGFERLGEYLPGELEVGSVEGPLRGPLLVRDLRYTSDRIHISMDRLALDWSLRELVRHRLDIRSLEADSVRIAIVATKTPPKADTLARELPDVDLPLDVLVGRARVHALSLTPAGSDSAIRIEEITLAEAAFRDTLEIGSLDVRARNGALHLAGRARTLGRYGVDLQSRWHFTTRAGREMSGGGRLVGSLDTLRLMQVIEQPFHGTIDVTAYTPMRDLGFLGNAQFSGLALRELDPAFPDARFDGRVQAGGNFDVFRAKGSVDARTPDAPRIRSEFRIVRRDSVVTVERLALAVPGHPARVVARGTVVTALAGPRGDLRGDWTAVSWPLEADSGVSSPRGTFHVAGTPERYRLEASGIVRHPNVPASPWTIRGSGSSQNLTLTTVDGQPLNGRVTGSAAVAWAPAVRWNARLAARGLDPAPVAGGSGRLDFDLTARGVTGRTELDFHGIDGNVRGVPVAGHAALTLVPDGYRIPGLDLHWGANHLTASGELRRQWNLTWALDAPDLTRVDPMLAGRLVGRGEFRGRGKERRITGTLAGDSLRYRDYTVRELNATADLHPGRNSASAIVVDLVDGRAPGRVVDHAGLRMDGWIDRHVLRAQATTPDESLRVAAEGGWARSEWNGRLTTLDLISRDFGTWGLEHAARLTAGLPRVALDDFCWRSGTASWCADGTWARTGAWTLATRIDGLELTRLGPFLPPGMTLSGPLHLDADVRGQRGQWTGVVNAAAGPGEMTYGGTGSPGRTPIDSVVLAIRATPGGTRNHFAAVLGTTGSLNGRLETPHFEPSGRLAPGPVSGTLQLRLRDLAFLQGFVPDFANTQGNATADLRLAGQSRSPLWSGNVNLTGQTDVPRLGIQIRDLRLTANSDESGRLRFESHARSGAGHLDASGEMGINPSAQFHATATLGGERFQVINTRDAKLEVTPQAQLAVNGDSIGVRGTLTVPRADLGTPERQHAAVPRSADVVFVTADSSETRRDRRPLRVHAEVRLVLGDNVHVHAYGLDARAVGSVLAIETPTAPTTGSGELRIVSGTYRAYGQRLEIERGRLVFAGGPITNPHLDVRATRKAQDGVVAGFEVGGTLEAPQFQVFSQPAMAERDALAYVIFGKRIDRGSQSEEDILSDAATTLGVGGGSVITETLARKLGIEEATIETSGALEESSLMLGTYLSPRLYVNYGVGLLDPVSTLRLQYFLNRHWTLQAQTGSETSAQFLYTVERR